MIKFNCEKCGNLYKVDVGYAGRSVKCKNCKHVIMVPISSQMPFGHYIDVTYKADGITPNFDELFQALAREEREAPTLINC